VVCFEFEDAIESFVGGEVGEEDCDGCGVVESLDVTEAEHGVLG